MENIYNILGINNEENDSNHINKNDIFNELCDYKFKLPIEYNEPRCLQESLKEDIEFNDISNNIMKNIFTKEGEDINKNLLINKWSTIYTTNKSYLKDNQNFINKYKKVKSISEDFIDTYHRYRNEDDFVSKYQYIDFERFKYLNYNAAFLQCLGMYNFLSPVITLFSPIIGLILPYFVFLFRGIPISFKNYLF